MAYLLHKANEITDIDIQPCVYTYKNYLNKKDIFIKEIIKTGIEIQ